MSTTRVLSWILVTCLLSSCAYLQGVSKQGELERSQRSDPRQYTVKHLIERDSYFVYGRLLGHSAATDHHALSIAAVSDKYRPNEIVDVNHLGRVGSYYGLNLPEGIYRLIVLEDKNGDGIYSETEVAGERTLELKASPGNGKVVGNIDIRLDQATDYLLPELSIPALDSPSVQPSLFYPVGTIRSLKDPIFDRKMATMGMYEPAAFLENAPMMFYALEEDTFYKIPVIFVHGIGGTPDDFHNIIDRLDRKKYKPWFFYYPSGMDLKQLADMFYEIFLSGKVVQRGMFDMVIVAHSMGGLIVREALNKYEGNGKETQVRLFVSMASPFGGLSSARTAVDYAPLVLPAWRDLSPTGAFIQQLFRKSLPASVEHHLIYAYRNTGESDDSDGIVPVNSQIPTSVKGKITWVYGFHATHIGILQKPAGIEKVTDLISRVKNTFPGTHLEYLSRGGFKVELGNRYTKMEKYMLQSMGFYLRALANGNLVPIPLNSHFLAVIHSGEIPENEAETAWLKFRDDYPDMASGMVD